MTTSYAPKRLNIVSAFAKAEATFGTDSTPVYTADGVLLQLSGDTANMMPDAYEYSGELGPNAIGNQPLVYSSPAGRSGSCDLPMYFWGYGAAYSSGHTPKNGFHTLMKGCGFSAVVDATGGAETWTYTPHPDSTTPTSLSIYGWSRQVLGAGNLVRTKLLGGLGNLKASADGAKTPMFTFGYKGIFSGDPAEASFTVPNTFDTSTVPPSSTSMAVTVDGVSINLYAWDYDQGRDLGSPRVSMTAAGSFLGYVAGPQVSKLKLTIEDELFATFNGYTKNASKATLPIVLPTGTTQYNKIKLSAPTAQIINVTPGGRGRVGLMDLELLLTPSTPTANDGHTWVAL